MNNADWIDEVKHAVRAAGVVDAHHHMVSAEQRRARGAGLIEFIGQSYLASDLAAAGLNWAQVADLGDEAAWAAIAQVLPRTRFTSYYRAVDVGFRDLLELDAPLWEADWRDLDDRLKAGSEDPAWTQRVLRECTGLSHGVVDRQATATTNYFLRHCPCDWYDFILHVRPEMPYESLAEYAKFRDCDPPLNTPSVKIDGMLWGYHPASREELEALYHVPAGEPAALDEYLAYIDECFRQMKREACVALKSAYAGMRRIDYRAVAREKAQALFAKPRADWTRPDAVAFEDFMIHYLAERSAEFEIPFQFHTGTPFSGPVADSDACCDLMTELVKDHAQTRFVLMHGGFPYTRELADLAKRFANVHIDISWLPLLSQAAAEQTVAELITLVPHEKIVWGGDAVYAEETYGAFIVGVEAVATALAGLIERGRLNRNDALELAVRIFGANARQIFALS